MNENNTEVKVEKVFTLFWLNGSKNIVRGEDINTAYTKAGFGAGAMPALDFYANGENDEYEFIKGKGWVSKKPVFNPN